MKENNNPEINETFRFPLASHEKTQHTAYFQVKELYPFFHHLFQVYDWDRFSKNDPIGEVAVYLGETNLSDTSPKWSILQVEGHIITYLYSFLQPMSKKKAPAPKPKTKAPTGPAKIRYQVGNKM